MNLKQRILSAAELQSPPEDVYYQWPVEYWQGRQERDAELKPLITALADVAEAVEMGAFHHSACASNHYSDETKENWNGLGDHRKSQKCTCAYEKIDEALSALEKVVGGDE